MTEIITISSDSGSSDESDSSLPDLSHLFQRPAADDPISNGDIVYAKFKNLYWPALVRAVYPKQKKISIWYCDDPGKTFKVPLKNVCSFFDYEMRDKILKDVRETNFVEAHEGLTSHARRYLIRKAQGKNDDPMKFFDQTHPFFLIEKLLEKDPNANVSGFKIPPLYITTEKSKPIKKWFRVSEGESGDSEVVPTNTDGEISETESVGCVISKISPLCKTTSDSIDVEYIDEIVKYILSGKTDNYLQQILSNIIQSEYYNVYENATKCGKRDLYSVSYSGPIKDSNKLSVLTSYLSSLFHNGTKTVSLQGSSSIYPSLSQTDAAHYIASVWLPESIIFAISEIKRISFCEAKCLFNQHPKSQRKAIEDVTSQDMLSQETDTTNNSSKTCEINNNTQKVDDEAIKHSDETICSAMKRMKKEDKNFSLSDVKPLYYNNPKSEKKAIKNIFAIQDIPSQENEVTDNSSKSCDDNTQQVKDEDIKYYGESMKELRVVLRRIETTENSNYKKDNTDDINYIGSIPMTGSNISQFSRKIPTKKMTSLKSSCDIKSTSKVPNICKANNTFEEEVAGLKCDTVLCCKFSSRSKYLKSSRDTSKSEKITRSARSKSSKSNSDTSEACKSDEIVKESGLNDKTVSPQETSKKFKTYPKSEKMCKELITVVKDVSKSNKTVKTSDSKYETKSTRKSSRKR